MMQINTDDTNIIQEIKNFIAQRHFDVQIDVNTTTETTQTDNSKWGDFAKRMSGLTTPKITQHIENTSRQMREDFALRDLNVK